MKIMNKKGMLAVAVTLLLAAALFVGAGAADSGDAPAQTSYFQIGSTIYYTGGSPWYETLATEMSDTWNVVAENGVITLTLKKDVTGPGIGVFKHDNTTPSDEEVIIDLGTHTYTLKDPAVGSTGTQTQGLHFEDGASIHVNKVTNGNLAVDASNKGKTTGNRIAMISQNYNDIEYNNVIVDGANLAAWSSTVPETYAFSINSGTVQFTGSTSITVPTGFVAFDVCNFANYNEPIVTVNTTGKIIGKIEYALKNNPGTTSTGVEKTAGSFTIQNGIFVGDIVNVSDDAEPSTDKLQISGGSFTDLATAVKYATDGATIKLAGDVTLDSQIDITKSISIEGVPDSQGNNPTITCDGAGFYIKADIDSLTLKNLTLEGQNTEAGEDETSGSFMGVGTYDLKHSVGTLTIENCTIQGFNYGLYFGAKNETDETKQKKVVATITNTTFSNNVIKGVYVENFNKSTFKNCTFENNGTDPEKIEDPDPQNSNKRKIWPSGVDINLKYGKYEDICFDSCTFKINGANFGSDLLIKARDDGSYKDNPATLKGVTITNCKFTDGCPHSRGGTYQHTWHIAFGEINSDTQQSANNKSPIGISINGKTEEKDWPTYVKDNRAPMVAAIGDIKYATIDDAVKDAKASETVKLLTNVALTETLKIAKSVTLDLNDKKISKGEGFTDAILIDISSVPVPDVSPRTSDNSVTIKNGEINGVGCKYTIVFSADDYVTPFADQKEATFLLEDLTITGGVATTGADQSQCIQIAGVASKISATIEDCTITEIGEASNAAAAAEGTADDAKAWQRNAVGAAYGATLNIKNSTIKSNNNSAVIVHDSGGTLNVESGEYSGGLFVLYARHGNLAIYPDPAVPSTLNVKGGKFTAGKIGTFQTAASPANANVVITGGKFASSANPTTYLKDNTYTWTSETGLVAKKASATNDGDTYKATPDASVPEAVVPTAVKEITGIPENADGTSPVDDVLIEQTEKKPTDTEIGMKNLLSSVEITLKKGEEKVTELTKKVAITFEVNLAGTDVDKNRLAVAHWNGTTWGIISSTVESLGDNKYRITAWSDKFSPFAVVELVPPAAPSKSSSSSSTSTWADAEPTVQPTAQPTATPTAQPTVTEVPSVVPIEKTPAPATPAPFIGILAGLGAAAAVFGLRRK